MASTDGPPRLRATPDPALLDISQTLAYLGGISRSTLKVLVWRGKLVPTKIGRRIFFTKAALDDYIVRHTGRLVTAP